MQGQSVKGINKPKLTFSIEATDQIETIDILRNSKVIKSIQPDENTRELKGNYIDKDYLSEKDVLYYYIRITQKNKHLGWSSPIWLDA